MTFKKAGFDTHAISTEDDKLNRWEFAKELYEIGLKEISGSCTVNVVY